MYDKHEAMKCLASHLQTNATLMHCHFEVPCTFYEPVICTTVMTMLFKIDIKPLAVYMTIIGKIIEFSLVNKNLSFFNRGDRERNILWSWSLGNQKVLCRKFSPSPNWANNSW